MAEKGDPLDPAIYSRVFEHHAEGRMILEELVKRFCGAGVVTTGGIDAVLKTYVNTAQRRPVDFILMRINQANGVKDDGHDE